ncbi:MAG TPA: DUF4157 domain-containing protein [Rhizomicrobium sp.]|jgi:hypothetical protein|nr:DUF4157 domain-containing protein [Rhizomicrobium sp.]
MHVHASRTKAAAPAALLARAQTALPPQAASTAGGVDLSGVAAHAPIAAPELRIGTQGDAAEREADRLAGQALNGAPRLQASATATPGGAVAPPAVHAVLASPGRPLDATARGMLEPKFGHDFSHVRVHDDAPAARSAQAVGAVAYTVGSHIGFRSGAYRPGTPSGQRLLAHELAHVVQQGRGAAVLQRQTEDHDGDDDPEKKGRKDAQRATFGAPQGNTLSPEAAKIFAQHKHIFLGTGLDTASIERMLASLHPISMLNNAGKDTHPDPNTHKISQPLTETPQKPESAHVKDVGIEYDKDQSVEEQRATAWKNSQQQAIDPKWPAGRTTAQTERNTNVEFAASSKKQLGVNEETHELEVETENKVGVGLSHQKEGSPFTWKADVGADPTKLKGGAEFNVGFEGSLTEIVNWLAKNTKRSRAALQRAAQKVGAKISRGKRRLQELRGALRRRYS